MYLNAILDVDISFSLNKVFHYVLSVLSRCNMQGSPLMEKMNSIATVCYKTVYIMVPRDEVHSK